MLWRHSMSSLTKLWRAHSLTIVLTIIGTACMGIAHTYDEGKGFDTWIGLGHDILGAVLVFALAGILHERNKPED